MTLLAKALIRNWWDPHVALAHARVGLAEAQASMCRHGIHEWSQAVAWLQWIAGPAYYDWTPPTLEEIHETMKTHRPQLPRSARRRLLDRMRK